MSSSVVRNIIGFILIGLDLQALKFHLPFYHYPFGSSLAITGIEFLMNSFLTLSKIHVLTIHFTTLPSLPDGSGKGTSSASLNSI